MPVAARTAAILSPVAGFAVDPRDLRVSDAERTHVMSLLQKATGRGLIDLAEFEERTAIVIAARTRAEVNATLLDLPGLVVTTGTVTEDLRRAPGSDPGQAFFAAPPPRFAAAPEGSSPPALRLAGWGRRDLRGHWVVPALIVLGGSGSTRLDFCDAQLTSPVVQLEFVGRRYGTVELIVPRGTGIRMNELVVRNGGIENRVRPAATGVLQLQLTGERRGGHITIRHPRRRLLGPR